MKNTNERNDIRYKRLFFLAFCATSVSHGD